MGIESTLKKINRASLKFLEPMAAEEVYKTIVREAVNLVGAKNASIFLEEAGELRRIFSTVPEKAQIIPRKSGYTYRSFKLGKAFILSNEKLNKFHPEADDSVVKSVVMIPLSYRKRSIGVLTIQSPKDERIAKEELNVLKIFGSFASLAIKKNPVI